MEKEAFFTSENWIVAAVTFQKNTLVNFSFHYNKSFGHDFEFSEMKWILPTSCWEVI